LLGRSAPATRGLTLAIALVLAVGVITMAAEVGDLSAVVAAIGVAILTPVWAVSTARGLSTASKEPLG
jgi:multisubunit Na+/H+ antiporter MnhG subunit